MLRKNGFSEDQVAAIVQDYHHADLSAEEVAVMEFAEKLSRDAHQMTRQDVEALRGHGLSDEEILDVALAAAARNFFSRLLDSLGAEPDAEYADLEKRLQPVFEAWGRTTQGFQKK